MKAKHMKAIDKLYYSLRMNPKTGSVRGGNRIQFGNDIFKLEKDAKSGASEDKYIEARIEALSKELDEAAAKYNEPLQVPGRSVNISIENLIGEINIRLN